MKVLFTNESPLIKMGLAEGFKQAGHEVKVIMGEEERLWNRPIEEQESRLRKHIENFKPDFVFTEGYPGCDPATIGKTIKSYGIPHLYWAIEDPVSPWLADLYAPYVDFIFTTTIESVPRYLKMDKPSEVLLFGCNPEFHHYTTPKQEYMHDIILVASNYSSRYEESAWFVMPLIKRGYDIKVYGLWWDDSSRPVNLCKNMDKYGGILPYEELPAAYSSAKIILGMNCDDSSDTQSSMRPYEALAIGGGLYLAHYTKAQKNIFGSYIEQAIDEDHTINTVDLMLKEAYNNPSKTVLKASEAQQFVYQNHNYKLRANQIIDAFSRIRK